MLRTEPKTTQTGGENEQDQDEHIRNEVERVRQKHAQAYNRSLIVYDLQCAEQRVARHRQLMLPSVLSMNECQRIAIMVRAVEREEAQPERNQQEAQYINTYGTMYT